MNDELDKAIATEIMGWEYLTIGYWEDDSETPRQVELHDWLFSVTDQWDEQIGDYYINVSANMIVPMDDFRPSTDIGAAWKVIENMRGYGCNIAVRSVHLSDEWECQITRGVKYTLVAAPQVEQAICKAALVFVQTWSKE